MSLLLKINDKTFNNDPKFIWIYNSESKNTISNSFLQQISYEWATLRNSTQCNFSILTKNMTEDFDPSFGETGAEGKTITRYTGLGTYYFAYRTSSSYVRETRYRWTFPVGRYIKSTHTYQWYSGDFQVEGSYWTTLKLASAEYQLNTSRTTYYWLAIT